MLFFAPLFKRKGGEILMELLITIFVSVLADVIAYIIPKGTNFVSSTVA